MDKLQLLWINILRVLEFDYFGSIHRRNIRLLKNELRKMKRITSELFDL